MTDEVKDAYVTSVKAIFTGLNFYRPHASRSPNWMRLKLYLLAIAIRSEYKQLTTGNPWHRVRE
jgi:hypothetical protein